MMTADHAPFVKRLSVPNVELMFWIREPIESRMTRITMKDGGKPLKVMNLKGKIIIH